MQKFKFCVRKVLTNILIFALISHAIPRTVLADSVICEDVLGEEYTLLSSEVSEPAVMAEANYSATNKTEDSVIEISTPEELFQISNNLAGSYILVNDIDLSLYENGIWKGIGSEENPFTGIFDGGNYTIKNLNLETFNRGLFNCTSGCTIRNVNIDSENILINYTYNEEEDFYSSNASGYYAGILIGMDLPELDSVSYIENCHISTDFEVVVNSDRWDRQYSIGGFVGYVRGTELQFRECSYIGNISYYSSATYADTYHNIGGFLGQEVLGKIVGKNSLFDGNIDGTVNMSANITYMGGFVGDGSEIDLSDCVIQGDLSVSSSDENWLEDNVTAQYIGGVAGEVTKFDLSNITVTGDIYNGGEYVGGSYAGGILGDSGSGIITDSSYIGKINNYFTTSYGDGYAGGFCGKTGNVVIDGCIVNCYIYNHGYYRSSIYTGGMAGQIDYAYDTKACNSYIDVELVPDAYSSAGASADTGGIAGNVKCSWSATGSAICISGIQLQSVIDDSSDGLENRYSGNLIGNAVFYEDHIDLDGNNMISGNKNKYGWINDEDVTDSEHISPTLWFFVDSEAEELFYNSDTGYNIDQFNLKVSAIYMNIDSVTYKNCVLTTELPEGLSFAKDEEIRTLSEVIECIDGTNSEVEYEYPIYITKNDYVDKFDIAINCSADGYEESQTYSKSFEVSFEKAQENHILVFTTEKSLSVKTDDSMWLAFGLYDEETDKFSEWKKMAVVVSDPTVVELSEYEETEYGYSIEVIGKKQGSTNVVITDATTGDSMTIQV